MLAAAGELGVPRIHFGVGTTNLLGLMGEAGADVVGVDWRTPLEQAIPLVGDRVVQGNLDPTLVFAPTEVMTARAAEIIEAGRAAKGHIFNLGHGVIPSTDPDQLTALTEFVHGLLIGVTGATSGRVRPGQLERREVGPRLADQRGLQVAQRLGRPLGATAQHQQRDRRQSLVGDGSAGS